MLHLKNISTIGKRALLLTHILLTLTFTSKAEISSFVPMLSPSINSLALRGLTTTGSAESMGEGRITFNIMLPWYQQETGYISSPNSGANVFTPTASFSYGVNSYVDIFTSISAFAISNYVNSKPNSGLGTISAGAQGSLPFPKYSYLRMGGQATIIGGTSQNQINTNRSDGYNYLETRTGYNFVGKLLQTVIQGDEEWGFKAHLNEAGVIGLNNNEPSLLLLSTGLQANAGFLVLGAELSSRTKFSDLSLDTDPLWFTPSIHFRTPYQMNALVGVDVSLSSDRSNNQPRALESYRVFGGLSFSFDMLAGKRKAALEQKQQSEQEKLALEQKASKSNRQVNLLNLQAKEDSLALENEKKSGQLKVDQLEQQANLTELENQATVDKLKQKTTSDSLALVLSADKLAQEKRNRSDAENMLLSTGELLLDAVYFETGKSIITINSKSYLNIIGKMLTKYPKLNFEVAGHTDNIGSIAYNNTLSQGRANAVSSYLTTTQPSLQQNLSAKGYGMSIPKADNSSNEGRLVNRRVELRVTNKDALTEYNQL